jgi:hypothetical protein
MIAIAKIATQIANVRNYQIFDGHRLIGVMTNAYGNPDRTADTQRWTVYAQSTASTHGEWDNLTPMTLGDAIDLLNTQEIVDGFDVDVVIASEKTGTLVSCRSKYGFKMYVSGINALTRAPILSGHRDDAFRFTKTQAREVIRGLFYHQSLPVLGDNYGLVFTEEAKAAKRSSVADNLSLAA